MTSSFVFTAEKIAKLSCPESKQKVRYMDSKTDGLALRVTAAGAKTFVYYRFLPNDNETPLKVCEIRIGKADSMSVEQARTHAKALNNIVENEKKNPALGRRIALTYDALFVRYISEYAQQRTKTWKDAVHSHQKYFSHWHQVPVLKMRRADVQKWVNELADNHGKHSANRHYNTLRAVLSWGIKNELWQGENPCIGVDRFAVQARERFIHPGEEYAKFAEALSQEPNLTMQDLFWTCLFTGARLSNVLAMEWDQVDFEIMVWRIPLTKNGDSQTIPLTSLALEILKRRRSSENSHEKWVFPSDRAGRKTKVRGHLASPKKAWSRLLARAGIQNLRIHDLRRTAGSYMAIQGISPTIIGKALGHRSPQATAIYARLSQDPVRSAMQNAQEAMSDPSKLIRAPNK